MGCCLGRETVEIPNCVTDNNCFGSAIDIRAHRSNVTVIYTIRPLSSVWAARGMSDDRPEFSHKSKRIVIHSWLYLRSSMYNIGIIMFITLFEVVPKVRECFGPDSDEYDSLDAASRHSQLILLALDKVLKLLVHKKNVNRVLHEFGGCHAVQRVRVEYLDLFIPHFIKTIHPALDEKWATTIEDAWADFFKYVVHLFKEAMVF